MRLATPESVLTILGIQQSAGSLAAAGAALDATFHPIESHLDTTLTRARRRDYFDLMTPERTDPAFRLSASFVSTDDPIVVSCDGVALLPEYYDIDLTLGVVHAYGVFPTGRKVVAITYSAGFEEDVDKEGYLGLLPSAITQAAASKAAAYLMLNPANIAKDKADVVIKITVAGLELTARNALSPFTRPRGTVVWNRTTEMIE